MGIFTKPTATDINKILPYIQDPFDALVWSITDTTNGVDTVSVTAYTDDELGDAYDEFSSAASTPKVLQYAHCHDFNTFTSLDYVRGLSLRLAPSRTFDNGVLTHTDYYSTVSFDVYGQEVFTDPVICEQYDYVRNSDGFAVSRTLTIKWITEAETDHVVTKTRYKTYNLTESIRETDRRRKNILDELKTNMIGLFVAAMGMTVDAAIQTGQVFFEHHINDIVAFKEIGEVQSLLDAITADVTHAWLDNIVAPPSTTMRQYMLSVLAGAILVGT